MLAPVGEGRVTVDKRAGGVAVVTLCNVKRANALSGAMMADLAAAVEELEAWRDGKAVFLQGEGGTFCAGADLSVARSDLASPEAGARMCEFMQHYLQRLRTLPMISVAVVTGSAVGGGAELSTACDLRVLHPDAQVRFVHTKMGVSPGWGGGMRLTRLVGRRTALRLLATAAWVTAGEALSVGLADHVAGLVDEGSTSGDSATLRGAMEWAAPMLHGPAPSVRGIKTVVSAADGLTAVDALEVERDVFASLWGGPAAQSALSSARHGQAKGEDPVDGDASAEA